MTRQKKEILKKISDLQDWIAVDQELGCGFAPTDAYDDMYDEIYRLEGELAHLQHYESTEAMLYDTRGCKAVDLPF